MKIKVCIYAEYDKYNRKYVFKPWSHKSEIWGGTFITETEIEFDEPSYESLTAGTVKDLRSAQVKLRAECEVKVQNIEQQIQEILCLEDFSGRAE